MTAVLELLLALTFCQTLPATPPSESPPVQTRSGDSGQRHEQPLKWWDDEQTVTALNLSKRQRARIRGKFEAWVPGQRTRVEELHAAEKVLSELLDDAAFDFNATARALEKVEEIRWQLSRSRSVMLLDLLSQLNADQRKKLRETNASASPGRGRQWDPLGDL